ncbi:ribosomal-processing cysteine protease Prp [Priestia taiwanensis]|uniref:Ribosomal processing cysteine protease Prp n=1 Tax=Priestia taiwanensis TaxID=1347902 RepID=A0A917ERE7_9BACI|nr:ribosomal-processing cysteine protease Prp [Priestia taiwanensis]MBM7363615.1 uncharacterized protein YsxB (DUF464 family) [Priestia taiwanensis]GGE75605.1 hypothetical protein GCM10007140_26740 [Priestia taiwanensis]
MIKVIINRANDDGVVSFKVTGHANFADHGKDIVCSAVTAVTVGTVNAIDQLCKISAHKHCEAKSGYLFYSLPADVDEETKKKAQLLIEGMIVSLRSIELSYGKFITITEKNQEV